MTKSTAKISKSFTASSSLVFAFNISLATLAAGLLLYYIVLANGQAANKYHLTSLNNELTYYTDLNNSLVAQQASSEDTNAIIQYAESRQMIEAKNISYVFENGNVALGK